MKEIAALLEQIKQMRRARCITNCLLIGKQMDALLLRDETSVVVSDRLIVIKEPTEHSTKLWFFAMEQADIASIGAAITPEDARPITVELVGKVDGVAALATAFAAPFAHCVTFSRWSLKRGDITVTPTAQDAHVAFAQVQHMPEIIGMLEQAFDQVIYALPSVQEMREYIENNQVYAYFEEDALLGFTIAYLQNKRLMHTHYSVVKAEARGKGVYNTVYAHIIAPLTPDVTVVQYADVKNPVTGRKDGVYGLTQDDFAKTILIYNQ